MSYPENVDAVKLADLYEPDELPTVPGTPNACARLCKHCGKVYGEHADMFPIAPTALCFGVKVNFDPEELSDADRQR